MIYPEFIKNGDYIGVTAPSDGVTDILDLKRLDNAKSKLQKLGLKVVETSNVRKSVKGRSSAPTVQAKELEDLFKNKKVKLIICAGGGEFLLEMLSYVDFDIIKNNPKWIIKQKANTGINQGKTASDSPRRVGHAQGDVCGYAAGDAGSRTDHSVGISAK